MYIRRGDIDWNWIEFVVFKVYTEFAFDLAPLIVVVIRVMNNFQIQRRKLIRTNLAKLDQYLGNLARRLKPHTNKNAIKSTVVTLRYSVIRVIRHSFHLLTQFNSHPFGHSLEFFWWFIFGFKLSSLFSLKNF